MQTTSTEFFKCALCGEYHEPVVAPEGAGATWSENSTIWGFLPNEKIVRLCEAVAHKGYQRHHNGSISFRIKYIAPGKFEGNFDFVRCYDMNYGATRISYLDEKGVYKEIEKNAYPFPQHYRKYDKTNKIINEYPMNETIHFVMYECGRVYFPRDKNR